MIVILILLVILSFCRFFTVAVFRLCHSAPLPPPVPGKAFMQGKAFASRLEAITN